MSFDEAATSKEMKQTRSQAVATIGDRTAPQQTIY